MMQEEARLWWCSDRNRLSWFSRREIQDMEEKKTYAREYGQSLETAKEREQRLLYRTALHYGYCPAHSSISGLWNRSRCLVIGNGGMRCPPKSLSLWHFVIATIKKLIHMSTKTYTKRRKRIARKEWPGLTHCGKVTSSSVYAFWSWRKSLGNQVHALLF